MTANSAARTLYEDWQIRRDRLAAAPDKDADFHAAELRLLNFLLRQYRGLARADRPARFPARGEVYLDRRAIVVHWHLGKGYLPEMHTRQEAERRVRELIEHMQSQTADDLSADEPLFNPAMMRPFDEKLEAIRSQLCDANAVSRLVAIVELGRNGTLDDIGLISDLLALPPQEDEDPYERHVLLTAMKKIVQRLTDKRRGGGK